MTDDETTYEPSEPQQAAEQEVAEPTAEQPPGDQAAPAATSFRRNIWLLVIVIGVVVFAWVLAALWKMGPQLPESVATSAPPAADLPPSPPPRETPPPGPAPVTLSRVIGSGAEVIMASPARTVRPGGRVVYRRARLFDVTKRLPDLHTQELIRLPARTADQRRPLVTEQQEETPFQPAEKVDLLHDHDRVAVIRNGDESRAYPVKTLLVSAGVFDKIGDTPVFVCWSFATQTARALVTEVGGRPIRWHDAGLLYHGSEVYYDEETGSLWDSFTGKAITGPAVGQSAQVVPVSVWPWQQWAAEHGNALVLSVGLEVLGPQGLQMEQAVNSYLQDQELPVPLTHFKPDTTPLMAKEFVLGIAQGGEARAYPLADLSGSDAAVVADSVGGEPVEVHVTSPRTGYATSEGRLLDAPVTLWFAWQEAYPDTSVYGAAPAEPGAEIPAETPVSTGQ
ncbi:MAG: DUF3179 domain-containing (seleno)protein [Planctomycetota bacterium]|jgi:hypothetical protein